LLGLTGGRQRGIVIDQAVRVENGIQPVDAGEGRARDFDRRQAATPEVQRQVGGVEPAEFVVLEHRFVFHSPAPRGSWF
jgi:hypothetical protein